MANVLLDVTLSIVTLNSGVTLHSPLIPSPADTISGIWSKQKTVCGISKIISFATSMLI